MGKSNEVGAIPYEKSNNVETSLFYIQGRITRKAFFIRLFLCVILWGLAHLSFIYLETPNYNEWVERGGGKIQSGSVQVGIRHKIAQNIDYYILPSILMFFMLIQSAKRVHDTNHSSKYLLIPFYNVYLLFSEGTTNDNDYGLLPHAEVKSPSYKANITEDNMSPLQVSQQKSKITILNIKWDDVWVWTVIGGFFVSILLNLIVPWFISEIVLWQKIALATTTIIGAYFVLYGLDDNHKGKYVAILGWSGVIAILLSTILTIYGLCGGLSPDTVDESENTQTVTEGTISQESESEKLISKPTPVIRIPNKFVRISSGTSNFYIDRYEVTQKDYVALMGNNPSKLQGDSLPVHGMSVRDAVIYCNKKSEAEGLRGFYDISENVVKLKDEGNGYRLPTEKEWILAARNPKKKMKNNENIYHGQQSLKIRKNCDFKPHVVGENSSNGWGLYDMYGNVCELCVRDNGEIWGKGVSYRNALDSEMSEDGGLRAAENLSSTMHLNADFGLRLVFIP